MTHVIRADSLRPLPAAVTAAITERRLPQLMRETDLAARTVQSFAVGERVSRPTLGKLALWARRHAPGGAGRAAGGGVGSRVAGVSAKGPGGWWVRGGFSCRARD